MLALKLIVQLPPKPLRFPRPQQNPESTMVALRAGPPFIVDAAEPGEMFEKLIAKRGFQPGEILTLRRPFAAALQPGTYEVVRPLTIAASGVVLRGSGSGEGATIIKMTGRPHVCVSVRGAGSPQAVGQAVKITNKYIPSGSDTILVADASSFEIGQTILIIRPVTEAWVHFMGMDTLVRDGKKQTWVSGQTQTERRMGPPSRTARASESAARSR